MIALSVVWMSKCKDAHLFSIFIEIYQIEGRKILYHLIAIVRGLIVNLVKILICLLCLSIQNCYASELTLQVTGSMDSQQVAEYVARVGQPSIVTVKEGMTLADVLKNHCGKVNHQYLKILMQQPESSLEAIDLGYQFEKKQYLTLPACLRLPKDNFSVKLETPKKNDSPWKYYSDDSAGFHNFRAEENGIHLASSGETISSLTYVDTFKKLNPSYAAKGILSLNEPIQVPETASEWTTLALREEGDLSLEEVTKTLNSLIVSTTATTTAPVFENPEKILLLESVTQEILASTSSCQNPSVVDRAKYPLDYLQLISALSASLSILKKVSDPTSSTVVIADTGLFTDGELPFSRKHLAPRSFESRYSVDVLPFVKYLKAQHGTFVATAVLGGPKFLELLDLLDIKIKLEPINIYTEKEQECIKNGVASYCTKHEVRTDIFNKAIKMSKNKILNLSVGRNVTFTGLEHFLSADSDHLFVVAAGNDGKSLLSGTKLYPARYGGIKKGEHNLISVAALDFDGSKAGFSNWSDEHVDIATYGCDIEVLRFDGSTKTYETTTASGTSFAAPFVSFTAALLEVLWPDASPKEIKERILVSADISDDLRDNKYVIDGRILNTVKAVSLYQDVVEVKIEGGTKLIKGEIDSKNRFFTLCNGDLELFRKADPTRKQIKKLAVIEQNKSGKDEFLIYWQDTDKEFSSKICSSNDFNITITEYLSRKKIVVTSQDIVDIVFSENIYL